VRSSVGAVESVPGNRDLLRRAVHHLVHNAIKFSPRRGESRVGVSARPGGAARLVVSDQGSGLRREARDRIFEPFSQEKDAMTEEDAMTREGGGLGIGLTLVRAVTEAHGGP
jgi:signal transduction histidine kinase